MLYVKQVCQSVGRSIDLRRVSVRPTYGQCVADERENERCFGSLTVAARS